MTQIRNLLVTLPITPRQLEVFPYKSAPSNISVVWRTLIRYCQNVLVFPNSNNSKPILLSPAIFNSTLAAPNSWISAPSLPPETSLTPPISSATLLPHSRMNGTPLFAALLKATSPLMLSLFMSQCLVPFVSLMLSPAPSLSKHVLVHWPVPKPHNFIPM